VKRARFRKTKRLHVFSHMCRIHPKDKLLHKNMHSRNINTPQTKNLRKHRNEYINSKKMSTNTKVEQKRLYKKK
jgi:hypothetical protein